MTTVKWKVESLSAEYFSLRFVVRNNDAIVLDQTLIMTEAEKNVLVDKLKGVK